MGCQWVVYLLSGAWVGWCVLCVLGPSRGLGRVGSSSSSSMVATRADASRRDATLATARGAASARSDASPDGRDAMAKGKGEALPAL